MAQQYFFDKAVNRLVVPREGIRVTAYRSYKGNDALMTSLGTSAKTAIGRATGRTIKSNDGQKWVEITLYKSVRGHTTAYVHLSEVLLFEATNDNVDTGMDGEKLLKNLLGNDREISKRLMLASATVNELPEGKAKNQAIDIIANLSAKLRDRQDHIKQSGLVKFQEVLNDSMDWLMDKIGLGVLPVIPLIPIAIGAGVGVVGAVSLYFVFKPDYDESQVDLKLTADLEKLLAKEDPKVAQKIKTDLEGQIDKAYNQGNTDGTFSGIFTIIKPLAIAALGFYAITKLPDLIGKVQKQNG